MCEAVGKLVGWCILLGYEYEVDGGLRVLLNLLIGCRMFLFNYLSGQQFYIL